MSLESLVDNNRTDKNTIHSYLPLYDALLKSKKETAKRVLEIGIWNGGSIKLWHDYFPNAKVHALDLRHITDVWAGIRNNERIVLHTSTDAYNTEVFTQNFINTDLKFDFLLDDGPHSLWSMQQFIRLYSRVMTEDGILIIEDVQDYAWIDSLRAEVPMDLRQYIKVYDLRKTKGRYDDLVFVIDKSGCN